MTGLLLIQLGTPESPTAAAVGPYLKQFLSDPRVIETTSERYWVPGGAKGPRPRLSRWAWRALLRTVILPTRSRSSAAKYRRIWDARTGSPLLHHTREQARLLQERFTAPVRFGMIVGQPSVEESLRELLTAGADRIVAVPMFPQYSSTTTASASDALARAMLRLRVPPALRIVPAHCDHPAYIAAAARRIGDDLQDFDAEHVVLSFHGLPQSYSRRGDPYATEVVRTTRALVRKLGWPRTFWTQSYQSRFGREPWLKPYTDDVLVALARRGVRRVAVATPGFTADCLETLDEIGHESAEVFRQAGGESLRAIPCLNEHPLWIDALEQIVRAEASGWNI